MPAPLASASSSPAVSAASKLPENFSLLDCLLHDDISSIIKSLSPFSKLISLTALDDRKIFDFVGFSGSDGCRASSFASNLIETIANAQNWLMFLMNEIQLVSASKESLSKPNFSISCSSKVLLHKSCECIASLRTCLERKVVTWLHQDTSQALESILNGRSPQILVTIGQYLLKIRSDKASFSTGEVSLVSKKESARAQVTCCLCSACPLFEFVHTKDKDPVCMQCYASVSQSHSVRPCDLLSVYALKLLRGEAKLSDDDTKAVINVFEYVYSSAEFSASKAALMCVCATLSAFTFSRPPSSSRRISKVILPRWVAHALFPEYSVSLAFCLGDSAPFRCAATLGWCQHSSDSSRTVTPLESVVLAALSGDSHMNSSAIASRSGTFVFLITWQCVCQHCCFFLCLLILHQVCRVPSSTFV